MLLFSFLFVFLHLTEIAFFWFILVSLTSWWQMFFKISYINISCTHILSSLRVYLYDFFIHLHHILRDWSLIPLGLKMTWMQLITLKWISPTIVPPTAPPVVMQFMFVLRPQVHASSADHTADASPPHMSKNISSDAADESSVANRWTESIQQYIFLLMTIFITCCQTITLKVVFITATFSLV